MKGKTENTAIDPFAHRLLTLELLACVDQETVSEARGGETLFSV